MSFLWRPVRCASTARSPLLPAGCSLLHLWCSAASFPTSLSDGQATHRACDTSAALKGIAVPCCRRMQRCSPISRGGGGFGLPQSLQLCTCTQTQPQPESYHLPSIIILILCVLPLSFEKKNNPSTLH